MSNLIELTNLEINEYCTLNKSTGELSFSNSKRMPGFTGLYFKDSNHFFAIYPSENGPQVFYKNKEYGIYSNLDIYLQKQGKNRKFQITNYDIEIDYLESPYIGFDVWSDEIDVDLFFMIKQNYKTQDFYNKFTLKSD